MHEDALPVVPAIPDEERARAHLYALLGRLFHGAADEALLAEIRGGVVVPSPGQEDDVSNDWNALVSAATASAESIREEHEALFGGVGKARVTPYTSAYLTDTAPDKHLVALRQTLEAFGMMRRNMVFEIEDHVSAMCDVMRLLIERDAPLGEQAAFFGRFVWRGVIPFCEAIERVEPVGFYHHVARLMRAFLIVEQAAFEMADS
jgi:TorA maturation chaperone TorD